MKRFAYILIALGILNFTAYWIISGALGGDAINGKDEGGRYYLSSHGRYTEVSRSIFEYSRFHTYSLCLTHPLVFIGILILAGINDDRKKHYDA